MQAVLLAAGKSSRFYPFNATLEHKSLITLMGKTLLEHTIESLIHVGCDNVLIVHGKDSIIPSLLTERKNIRITYIEQAYPIGAHDALQKAYAYLEESFFLLGAYHVDILDFAVEMQTAQKDASAVVLVRKDDIFNRYGSVTLDGKKVVDIEEKPTSAPKSAYRLLSLYLLPKAFVESLEKRPDDEFYFEKALSHFAKAHNVHAVVTEKPSVTLKYAWDLLGIKDYLLSKIIASSIAPSAVVGKDALISGSVVIEEGASIMEGACIKGPAYVGKNATIGNRAVVRGGVIVEEGATIGSQMEIKNAVVMEKTTTHSGFIGDSLIGAKTKIAAGFITANARLDRQSVKTVVHGEKVDTGIRHLGVIVGSGDNIGIRVSTMPGIFIGNDVVVGPSTTVMKNVADNTKYYTKFQEIIEENDNAK